jgi:predicted nucleotidyltransferase
MLVEKMKTMDNQRMILAELKALLMERYVSDIEKIILFGSRSKGKAKAYSDYDILIIVKHDYDWRFKREIQDLCWEIDFKFDILTDVKIISLGELGNLRGKQPYILNALETGILL